MKPILLALPLLMAGCITEAPTEPARPQDEVPVQRQLPGGEREYSFQNGCVIVLQATQAVVVSETAGCELYQRDIALLYASGA
jgi:hypothetical protein